MCSVCRGETRQTGQECYVTPATSHRNSYWLLYEISRLLILSVVGVYVLIELRDIKSSFSEVTASVRILEYRMRTADVPFGD